MTSLASEAGLAVLVALRYYLPDYRSAPDDLMLGWTETDATPWRINADVSDQDINNQVGQWLEDNTRLLAAIRSRVLPEADVVLLNPRHVDAALVPPLTARPFDFAECLHRPPMLDNYRRQE